MNNIEKELTELQSWANALAESVKIYAPQILDALDPNKGLPENCPSHASLAEMVYRQIRKKFSEVEHCMKKVEDEIWTHS